ncbi:MAG: DNA polymerase III subunit beta [Nitrospirae bacterium]|nr:DNA polymerase III subunit beta [Nitrospirota bacterium]
MKNKKNLFFRLDKDELIKKLQHVQSIIVTKSSFSNHFLLNVEEKNLYANDLEVALKEPINIYFDDFDSQQNGKLCIPIKKLLEITKELEDKNVTFELLSDKQWVKIMSGKSEFKLALLSSKDYPDWPNIEDKGEIILKAGDLAEMIEKTIYAVGDDNSRYAITGLLLDIKPNGIINIVGTDKFRLAMMTKVVEHDSQEERKLIIPRKTAYGLGKLLDGIDTVRISFSENQVLFKTDNFELISTLIEGEYPNYEQIIPQNDKVITLEGGKLTKSIRRAAVINNNNIKIDISTNTLTISSSDPNFGEAFEKIELANDYKGEPVQIGFNARYITDYLINRTKDMVSLYFRDTKTPVLIKSDDDSYKYILAPMIL